MTSRYFKFPYSISRTWNNHKWLLKKVLLNLTAIHLKTETNVRCGLLKKTLMKFSDSFIHLKLRRFVSLRPQLFIAKNVTYCGIASHTQSTSWINMGVCFAWCVSFSFRVCALLRSLHRFAAASWWTVCLFQHWY